MPNAAVDNDVLIKLAAYQLLAEGLGVFGDPRLVGVLGAARFVVPSAIQRHDRIRNKDVAAAEWRAVADVVETMEPSTQELVIATAIEEAALRRGLPLDSGESQLCAIAIERSLSHLATGDKRAIATAETISIECVELGSLAGKVVCLEQLVKALIAALGPDAVRRAVCSEAGVDRALSVCLSCASLTDGSPFDGAGLASYIADLRANAPTLLAKHLPVPS